MCLSKLSVGEVLTCYFEGLDFYKSITDGCLPLNCGWDRFQPSSNPEQNKASAESEGITNDF